MPKPDSAARAAARKQARLQGLGQGLDPMKVTKEMLMGRSAKDAFAAAAKAERNQPPQPLKAQKQMLIEISPELHTQFKVVCAARGQTMRETIIGLMEKAVQPFKQK